MESESASFVSEKVTSVASECLRILLITLFCGSPSSIPHVSILYCEGKENGMGFLSEKTLPKKRTKESEQKTVQRVPFTKNCL
jgi:hypothetical protein